MMTEGASRDAEAWFARLRAGKSSPAERAEFEAWLAQDAANRAAFEKVENLWGEFESVRADPAVLVMREQARGRQRSWRTHALVAGIVVAAGLLGVFGIQQGVRWHMQTAQKQASSYETRVGQKSSITLPDGSLVVLDTDSAFQLRTTKHERHIDLVRGRAFFHVTKDANRPFSVTAGGNTATALGTSFDVELKPSGVAITLVTGRLRVNSNGAQPAGRAPSVEMYAGQRIPVGCAVSSCSMKRPSAISRRRSTAIRIARSSSPILRWPAAG
jgi:transmembrane sensor